MFSRVLGVLQYRLSSSYAWTQCTNPRTGNEWSRSLQCIAQCRRPDGERVIPAEKEFYDQGENALVRCKDGYRLSSSYAWTQCTTPRKGNEWSPFLQCIAQCRRPDGEGVIPAEKEFYDQGENALVRCKDGYRLSSSYVWTQCTIPRTGNEWSPSPQCVAQCKKPKNTNMFTISGEKPYYNLWETVSVQCKAGYRPLYERITCVTGQKKDKWDNNLQCIEFTIKRCLILPIPSMTMGLSSLMGVAGLGPTPPLFLVRGDDTSYVTTQFPQHHAPAQENFSSAEGREKHYRAPVHEHNAKDTE
ncbi:C4b-binding protein alpha chain-like [Phyllobates terribilis]|uniref:C4b-binding protein alpha chain-like n=1 Tax=Phyllobates terribilis TaxID=111132 RepID=UPI003CCB504B